MALAGPYERVRGRPSTDWTSIPTRVECPECGKSVPLALVTEGEYAGEYVTRAHQTPGDGMGCLSGFLVDVEASLRPVYGGDA